MHDKFCAKIKALYVNLERSWRVSLRNLSETASMYTPSFQQRCRQSHSVTLDCNANPNEPSAALEEPTCIGLGVGAERAVSKDCAISWNLFTCTWFRGCGREE